MKKILLVHHTAHHFETLISFYDTLAPHYDVSIWSNSLHLYGRLEFLRFMGARIFEVGQEFNASVIITYDEPLTARSCGERLLAQLAAKPSVKVQHRFYGSAAADEVHLFPGAPTPFIPASSGFPEAFSQRVSTTIDKFLVQGNVEARRNYDILAAAIPNERNITVNIVGKFVSELSLAHEKISFSYDLSELAYRTLCCQNHFICPMIDPVRYRQYFTDRFSSSVQAGYSFALPFIAHKRLFDLYPLAGFCYETDAEFAGCLLKALDMTEAAYREMVDDLLRKREAVGRGNLRSFEVALSAAETAARSEIFDNVEEGHRIVGCRDCIERGDRDVPA